MVLLRLDIYHPLSLLPLFSRLLELIYFGILGHSGHSFDHLRFKSNPLSSLHRPPLQQIDGHFRGDDWHAFTSTFKAKFFKWGHFTFCPPSQKTKQRNVSKEHSFGGVTPGSLT